MAIAFWARRARVCLRTGTRTWTPAEPLVPKCRRRSTSTPTYASGVVRQRPHPVDGYDRLLTPCCIHVAEFLGDRQTGVHRKSQTVDVIPPSTTDLALLQHMDTWVVCAIEKHIPGTRYLVYVLIPCFLDRATFRAARNQKCPSDMGSQYAGDKQQHERMMMHRGH